MCIRPTDCFILIIGLLSAGFCFAGAGEGVDGAVARSTHIPCRQSDRSAGCETTQEGAVTGVPPTGELSSASEADPGKTHSRSLGNPVSLIEQLSSLPNPFPVLLRSLGPLPSLARAPFLPRARLRVSPETLNEVVLGNFSTPLSTARIRERDLSKEPIRIVTWNIERGLQYEKILETLRGELRADIYVLQEVDRYARRTEFRDVARSLASELGMHFAYGIEFQELIQGRSNRPALHGQATLSRFPIENARVLRFQTQPKDWSRDWFQPREGGRMALVTRIATPAGNLLIYNAHLESRGKDQGRAQQMKEIVRDARKTDPDSSLLVVGDFNTGQGKASPVFRVARNSRLKLVPFRETLSARDARRQKDWILIGEVKASSAVLHDDVSASDHKPVSAQIVPEAKNPR